MKQAQAAATYRSPELYKLGNIDNVQASWYAGWRFDWWFWRRRWF
jgi:hypothetical protein